MVKCSWWKRMCDTIVLCSNWFVLHCSYVRKVIIWKHVLSLKSQLAAEANLHRLVTARRNDKQIQSKGQLHQGTYTWFISSRHIVYGPNWGGVTPCEAILWVGMPQCSFAAVRHDSKVGKASRAMVLPLRREAALSPQPRKQKTKAGNLAEQFVFWGYNHTRNKWTKSQTCKRKSCRWRLLMTRTRRERGRHLTSEYNVLKEAVNILHPQEKQFSPKEATTH